MCSKFRSYNCKEVGCSVGGYARGWCQKHYRTHYNNGTFNKKICYIEGCGKHAAVKKLCKMHYGRLLTRGEPGEAEPRRASNGDGSTDCQGYRHVFLDGKNKAEHRVLMEKHIGRPLTKYETVHHKNGNRSDNRIENLELWSSHHPRGQRVTDKIEWAKQILVEYKDILHKL